VVAARDVQVWECNTPGGRVIDALRIGIDLHRRHAVTSVPAGSICASAGALAWLSGARRQLSGRLLFHGPTPEMTPNLRWSLFLLLLNWDVPQWIVERVVALHAGEFWEPDAEARTALVRQ